MQADDDSERKRDDDDDDEEDVWHRPLPPPFIERRPQLYDDPQKSAEWLARRTEQTASAVAANVGLSPYPDANPPRRWEIMAGRRQDPFRGNIYTEYGERYEPRIRAIGVAILGGHRIDEYGLFRSWTRRFQSISPDGETQSLRVRGRLLDSGRRVDWTLGKVMWEIKASIRHFYATPKLPHIAQNQFQMHVCGRHWGVLHYWSGDRTRAWLMARSPGFTLWLARRLDLQHEHTQRQVPVTDDNPYFTWRHGAKTLADYLEREWFSRSQATGRPARPPIPYAAWQAELALLGMTEQEWRERYPDTAPRRTRFTELDGAEWGFDAGQLAQPPRPELYKFYEYERRLPLDDVEPGRMSQTYVRDRDPVADAAWFAASFPTAMQWAAAHAREGALPPRPADENMEHLLIDEVLSAPEHDEPPPQDERALDSDEERAHYARRLQQLRDEAARPVQTPPSSSSSSKSRKRPSGTLTQSSLLLPDSKLRVVRASDCTAGREHDPDALWNAD